MATRRTPKPIRVPKDPDQLTQDDLGILKNMERVRIVDEFEDDHVLCIVLEATWGARSTVVNWWWCGPEGWAAAHYANECAVAMADLVRGLKREIENWGNKEE